MTNKKKRLTLSVCHFATQVSYDLHRSVENNSMQRIVNCHRRCIIIFVSNISQTAFLARTSHRDTEQSTSIDHQ